MPALKVFRTPIGFHDAYVAAPSKKAALAAWGSSKDLFARGSAELVTDPALIKEPLSAPGTVFKRSRGTAAEQIAALPKDERGTHPKRAAASPAPAEPIAPRPDRSALDAAEAAIVEADEQHRANVATFDAKIAELETQRAAQAKRHDVARAKLDKARAALDATYQRALAKWRG